MKKKMLFITLYDMICSGVRLMSALTKETGIESHFIIFKGEKSYIPIWANKDHYPTYQYYYNGLLRGSFYAVDPHTSKDVTILLRTIREIQPDVICLSTRSFGYLICKEIFRAVKQAFPEIPLIGGGWGPTLEPEKFLEFCDYVCFGEGERVVLEICTCLKETSQSFTSIHSLIYKKDNAFIRNEVAVPLSDKELNDLPFPDFSLENKYFIDDGKLQLGKDFYNEKVYDCFAGRGCPLNCSYCMSSKYRKIYKEYTSKECLKYRLRNIDTVLEEVRQAKERGARFIRFKDEVFPIYPRWIKSFLERYKKEIGLPFFGFVRPEFHSVETIRALKDAGLCVTMVGIQSGASEILRTVYMRTLSKEKIVLFAKTLDELDIQFSYHFIYRNPFENETHLIESLEFTYSLPFRTAFIYKLQLFPGSPLNKMFEEQKPNALPKHVYDWYAILHSLSLKGSFYRKNARFIHQYKIMRRFPYILALFFVPSLIKEYYNVLKNKYVYKARLHFSPETK